jgi:nitroreductase
MDLDKAIKERHSVRNFKTTKKPDYRKIILAIEAATKAPLAGNNSSIKYILVSDKEKIKQLSEAAEQDFFRNVDFLVVVCSDKKSLDKSFLDRASMYSRQQAGAAIENFLLKITDLGLSSCWIGAFADDLVRKILKIPENIELEAMLPVGYELGKTKPVKKSDLDRVMFFDGWGYERKFMTGRAAAKIDDI